jgi:hypothetical protein
MATRSIPALRSTRLDQVAFIGRTHRPRQTIHSGSGNSLRSGPNFQHQNLLGRDAHWEPAAQISERPLERSNATVPRDNPQQPVRLTIPHKHSQAFRYSCRNENLWYHSRDVNTHC